MLFSSAPFLNQVMEGLGLAMAVHSNMAALGWVTVTVLLVITGGSGGTEKRNIKWNYVCNTQVRLYSL